jgi:hypothetical protein
MFDALARLANGNARRIGLFAIAFFVLAGVLGGSVASRLDPYGAEDPATETVKAKDELQAAGLRVPAVVAVVKNAPVAAPATRARQELLLRVSNVSRVTGAWPQLTRAFPPGSCTLEWRGWHSQFLGIQRVEIVAHSWSALQELLVAILVLCESPSPQSAAAGGDGDASATPSSSSSSSASSSALPAFPQTPPRWPDYIPC